MTIPIVLLKSKALSVDIGDCIQGGTRQLFVLVPSRRLDGLQGLFDDRNWIGSIKMEIC